VKKIRILLAGMPAMLFDIVTEVVTSEPDLAIVGTVHSVDEAGPAARRARADVVVIQQASDREDLGEAVLASARRPVKVITLTDNGRQAFLCELRPHRVALGEMSAGGLVAAIRAAAQSAG
jgi:AmiR/NasT family two-component response regulator